eukprot:gene32362-41929_t
MPVYAIRSEDLYVQNAERIIMPRELEGVIMPTQWATICAEMDASKSQATMMSCCTELGQPVLAYSSGILTVNTDYLAQAQVVVFTTRSNPTVTNIMHTKVEDASCHPPMAAVHGPVSAYDNTASYVEVVASPVAVETRSMYVVIPSNAGPGSVLTVVAPNGAKLTVVCPPDTHPGSQILVNY